VPQFFLITSARALQAEFLDTIAAIECPLAEAIAASTGADSQGELGGESVSRLPCSVIAGSSGPTACQPGVELPDPGVQVAPDLVPAGLACRRAPPPVRRTAPAMSS
jgi:hypothetical protein